MQCFKIPNRPAPLCVPVPQGEKLQSVRMCRCEGAGCLTCQRQAQPIFHPGWKRYFRISVTENEWKSLAKISWKEPTLCIDECGKTIFAAWDQNMRLLLPDEPCFIAHFRFKIPESVRRVKMLKKDTQTWEHLLRKSRLASDSPWLQHVSKEEFVAWLQNVCMLKSGSKVMEPIRSMSFPSGSEDQVDTIYEDEAGNVTMAWTTDGQPIVVVPFLNLTVAGIRSQMNSYMFLQNAALSKGYLAEIADKAKQIPMSMSELDESSAVVVSGEQQGERTIVLLRSAKWVSDAIRRYLSMGTQPAEVKGPLSCSKQLGGEWSNNTCVRQCPTGKYFLPTMNKCVNAGDPRLIDYWETLAENNKDIKTLKVNAKGLEAFISQVQDLKTALGQNNPDYAFVDTFLLTLMGLYNIVTDMKAWLQLYGQMESKGGLTAEEVKVIRLELISRVANIGAQMNKLEEMGTIQREMARNDPNKKALLDQLPTVFDDTAFEKVFNDFEAKMKALDAIDAEVTQENLNKVRSATQKASSLAPEVVQAANDLIEAAEEGDREAAQANLSQLRSKSEAFNAQAQDAYRASAGLEAQVAAEVSNVASTKAAVDDAVNRAVTAVESANWQMERELLVNSCKSATIPFITTVHLNDAGLVDLVWNNCGDWIVPQENIVPQQQIPAIMVYQGNNDAKARFAVRTARTETKLGQGSGDALFPMLAKTATVQKELNASIEFYNTYKGLCEALPGATVLDGVCKRMCPPGENYAMGQCFPSQAPRGLTCAEDEELVLTAEGWRCMPAAPEAPMPLATSLRLSTPAAPQAPMPLATSGMPLATSLRLSTPAAPEAPIPLATSNIPLATSLRLSSPAAPEAPMPLATSLRLSTPAAPEAPMPLATSLRLSSPAATPLSQPVSLRVSSGIQAPPTFITPNS